MLSFSQAYGEILEESYWRRWRNAWKDVAAPLVVLHGGYGKRNLGDDAILHVLLCQLKAAIPEAQVVVLCHGPERVQRAHGVTAYHFTAPKAWRAICQAHLYIIGGGGIINRINAYSGYRRWRWLDPKGKFLFLAARLAKACGAKVCFHVIGATSVPDPLVGWLARWAMGAADAITVRDPASRQVLQALGVRQEIAVHPDPAVSLKAAPAPRAREILRAEGLDPDKRLVGLNLRPVIESDIDDAETAAAIAQVIDTLAVSAELQVCFLPFGRHPSKVAENDEHLGAMVGERLREATRYHVLRYAPTPPEMKAILAQMDFCILERLHATILAASVGTPFVAISYDAKVSQFLAAIGEDVRACDLRDLTAEGLQNLVARYLPWRI
jgi:polysaccharide pyruvyl transferase WcaK-like protein